MELSSYEKQMLWKKAKQKKEQRQREDSQRQQEPPKFEPTLYSHPVREFDGPAREISERSGRRHVDRQSKGRTERSIREGVIESEPQHRHHHNGGSASSIISDERNSIISYANSHQTDPSWYVPNTSSKDATFPATHNMPHILPALPSAADSIPPNAHQFDYLEVSSTSSSEEEPIIEQLERERRQWQSERERLLQCIHLQQLELSQRALAAQERALEIAQDFARLIETFEERLVTVETNVQKEIASLKVITTNLLQAQGKNNGNANANGSLDNNNNHSE